MSAHGVLEEFRGHSWGPSLCSTLIPEVGAENRRAAPPHTGIGGGRGATDARIGLLSGLG